MSTASQSRERNSGMAHGQSVTDKLINREAILHMVDEDNLQTRILSTLVSGHFSTTCHIINLNSALQNKYVSGENYIVLINCLTYPLNLVTSLLNHLHENNEQHSIALINMTKNNDFEDLIKWPRVMGMFYADSNPEQLLKGIQEIINNGHWLPRHLTSRILNSQRQPPLKAHKKIELTSRETQILQHLMDGQTNQEIGENIHVSSHTVRSHLYNIFKKINVKNRTQAGNWAKQYL